MAKRNPRPANCFKIKPTVNPRIKPLVKTINKMTGVPITLNPRRKREKTVLKWLKIIFPAGEKSIAGGAPLLKL